MMRDRSNTSRDLHSKIRGIADNLIFKIFTLRKLVKLAADQSKRGERLECL